MPKKTLSIVGALVMSAGGTLGFLQLDSTHGSLSASGTSDAPFVLQAAHAISIKNLQFNPNMMDMAVGDTVTWTNNEEDGTVHNITSDDGSSFVSPDVPPAQTFSFTPSSPGTYGFHCRIHPQTTGTLNVSGEGSAPPPEQPPPPPPPPPSDPEPPPPDSGGLIPALPAIPALPITVALLSLYH